MEKQNLFTGDPFVDNGFLAKSYLKDISNEPQTDLDLINRACDIYVDRWSAKINALFLNSKVTQPAFKPPQKKEKTYEFYQNLGTSSADATGYCRTCGSQSPLFKAGRDVFCLTGSGDYANFHHGHEPGIMVCKECLINLFFLPLSVLQMGGRLALLQLNSPEIKAYWKEKTVAANLTAIGIGSSDSILRSKYANPKNALFNLAKEIIDTTNADQGGQFLELYHFTNFGASPDCEIYRLPAPVFTFLNNVLRYYKKDWYDFVRIYYRISGASWQDETDSWQKNKQGDSPLDESEYLNNPNLIYEKLLAGESIISFFAGYAKRRYLKNLPGVHKFIVRVYIEEVMQMEKERINVIKRVADTILDMAKEEDAVNKYLTKIQGPQNAYELRSVIVWMVKRHNKLHPEQTALITLDEYLDYLFPLGQFWSEIRDLMLIYLYQRLHEENIRIEEAFDNQNNA
ncbi:type I-B CRISPR-associated protein Cas8b1/Cst1 [uncultured Desulfobacter sp.]|uniref:type I-B CRISPR-associated protein Cas8b1/Cst1 n=1 Tax=uncultured Desulfobacter sp. TaxID=240139 RepID=UPI0029F57ADB|nr:type I-B CRISPR-associated protein Cas8b1/Cst1 [uncultured Desulfobacter sp.]